MSKCGAQSKCCEPKEKSAEDQKAANTRACVKNYYGEVLKGTKDLKTNACTASGLIKPAISRRIKKVPNEVRSHFYGCGAPLPLGITGLRVLDLGSGSGRDSYVAADLVGPTGSVTGVDMTPAQLEIARAHVDTFTKTLGYDKPNISFVEGNIEDLDKANIADSSHDIIISNCVINLAQDKLKVLQQAYRVLAPGGEMYFSDVYCDRRLPEELRKHDVLWGECLAGALHMNDFVRLAKVAGFGVPRVIHAAPLEVNDEELGALLGPAKFYSITVRLFKIPGLVEETEEDYGQVAVYKGGVEGSPGEYVLDLGHRFEVGRAVRVSGNTAAVLGEGGVSWLSKYFEVRGSRETHFGGFEGAGEMLRYGFSEEKKGAGGAGTSCCL